ncbi:GrpB family protein [Rhizobium sp. VS19-DR104.2]|uniref:GrpB family protein n=1 Tax=unclassified Rhizobium TaxID=2613769 RepID=UPI001C5B4955|nr:MULTISPECIES: GrpB family protein [unclassified Rhizobium]MBZ5760144.1 GrpB family protein [Rhizobium sp. VS19-DR96]MBZ5766375.1 GrpB family protein [Rhizobium sp. VS19-DR129.2]MBZ5774282.1 GrpB family protein [Rhizobium sp. VS19-DRK62.2]MBZ5785354.1 GrpB family protein [Rhizobium sp. VS19-DR121]MBZ5802953.1 GrpB family protein [Rhizobium sp. VS19-DR181]
MQRNEESAYGLGVKHKLVVLAEPDDRWPKAYAEEAECIRLVLGALAIDIQHFGSTSIPGIRAKPVIDIIVGIRRFEDGSDCIKPMESIGYDYAGADIVPDDHIFGRGIKQQTRTHLVHIVEHQGFHWRRNLLFRDKLRTNAALASEYEDLKISLAAKFSGDRAAYTDAKKAFIDKVVGNG